ncbi:MAG: hypothetical protein A3I66_22495 [Burkholderiales bacterium RIFCSPLOWO2_02_FULL_57_36]|nr:MAG: hypothetical protein A3I66_22495 [Burkholderiales bacterium RIFCSPLOWO2_02_FULL_57_36]
MNHKNEEHHINAGERKTLKKSKIVLVGFLLVIGYFLWMEHQAHVIEYLPYLLLAACVLMHVFMHRGHGHDRGPTESEKTDREE